MIAARLLMRLAILVLIAVAPASVALPYSQAIAQVYIPPGCDLDKLNTALEQQVVPDFHKCSTQIAGIFANRLNLQIAEKSEPSEDTDPGLIARQEPTAGSPPPESRIVTVFVSTGPPPRISAIKIDDQTVEAGKPLQFAIAIEPANAVGKLTYSITGGTAQADRDFVVNQAKGELTVSPDATPPAINIETSANPAVTGDLTVELLVTAETGARDIAIGTIHELAAPCTTGQEPSCPQPPPCTTGYEATCPCVTGDEPSCPPRRTWWEQIIDVVSDLPPWVWPIPIILFGGPVVYRMWPRPVDGPPEIQTPTPTPTPTPDPPPTTPPPIDVVTTYPAALVPPRVAAKGSGPKTPIVSLVVNTTRVIPRIIATRQSREGQDG